MSLKQECDLWDCCRHGTDCWGPKVVRPNRMHYRVPYVGPAYVSRRILLVGMNGRDDGSIAAEFRGMAEIIRTFRSGSRDYGGQFHFRAACVVGLLAAAQDGRMFDETPTPEALVGSLLASARIQAVQCAPMTDDDRRSPTPTMWRNCPPLVMAEQVGILEPRLVALLGVETHRRFQQLPGFATEWDSLWRENNDCFARGSALVAGHRVPVFALSHPANVARWQMGMRALVSSIRSRPIAVS